MNWREFISLLGGTAVAGPLAAALCKEQHQFAQHVQCVYEKTAVAWPKDRARHY